MQHEFWKNNYEKPKETEYNIDARKINTDQRWNWAAHHPRNVEQSSQRGVQRSSPKLCEPFCANRYRRDRRCTGDPRPATFPGRSRVGARFCTLSERSLRRRLRRRGGRSRRWAPAGVPANSGWVGPELMRTPLDCFKGLGWLRILRESEVGSERGDLVWDSQTYVGLVKQEDRKLVAKILIG